jgi:hypothetical protein
MKKKRSKDVQDTKPTGRASLASALGSAFIAAGAQDGRARSGMGVLGSATRRCRDGHATELRPALALSPFPASTA